MSGKISPSKKNRHLYLTRVHDETVEGHIASVLKKEGKGPSFTGVIEELIEARFGTVNQALKEFIKAKDLLNGSSKRGVSKNGKKTKG